MNATATANINDTFFNDTYQEVWRKLIPPGLSEVECSFIEEIANLHPGDAVLDLLCGYGRHTLELARRGYPVTAVDNAGAYIEEIAGTAHQQNLPVHTISCGVLTMELQATYKAAICMGNSFAFFDRDDALNLLKKIAAHLQPGGVLLINSWMIAEIAIKHFREKEWLEVEGYKYLLDYRFEFQPSRIESEHTLIGDDGSISVLKGVDYIFTLAELDAMFEEAGFTTTGLYATPRKRPFRMGDNRIYIVASRKPNL